MTYRRKNIFLVSIFLIVGVYAFTGPIRNTFLIKKENSFLESSVRSMNLNLTKSNEISHQLAEFDSLLNTNSGVAQGNLLEEIGHLSQENNVIVKSLADPEKNSGKIYDIETFTITLDGTYKSLLRIIFELERKPFLGRVISADFKLSGSEPLGKKRLYCTLHIQKYKPKVR